MENQWEETKQALKHLVCCAERVQANFFDSSPASYRCLPYTHQLTSEAAYKEAFSASLDCVLQDSFTEECEERIVEWLYLIAGCAECGSTHFYLLKFQEEC